MRPGRMRNPVVSPLLALGWPQGAPPSVPTLVSHVLDRLEYRCARDIAYAEGVAGELLRGGEGAGGSASVSAGGSEGESDAEATDSAAVAEWLDAAGLSDLAHAAGLDSSARRAATARKRAAPQHP